MAIKVNNRIHSTAVDEQNPANHHVVAGADEIYDDNKGKRQTVVNAETDAALDNRYTKEEVYTKNQVEHMVTPPNPEYRTYGTYGEMLAETTHPNGAIYRVSNYDGSLAQVDATKYSEYSYDGNYYVFLCVKSQIGEIFDISEYNNAVYNNLSDALGTNGANVPATIRRGGMLVKFKQITTPASYSVDKTEGLDEQPTGTELLSDPGIDDGTYNASQLSAFATLPTSTGAGNAVTYWMAVSGDSTTYTKWVVTLVHTDYNKYVQYRLMSDTFNTTVANWQGVDNEPVAGSENLVKSGGLDLILGVSNLSPLNWVDHRNISNINGKLLTHEDTIACETLIEVLGDKCYIIYEGSSEYVIKFNLAFFDSTKTFISRMSTYINAGTEVTCPTGTKYVRVCLALYSGDTSIGGNQSDYDLAHTIIYNNPNSINRRINKNASDIAGVSQRVSNNADEIISVKKNLIHTEVLLGNNKITVTEPMIYGGSVTLGFSKVNERVFIVKLNGMTGADIDILPPSAQLVVPHNSNLWINYSTRQLVVSNDMSMEKGIFMGRNYIGRLTGGIFGDILTHINKKSIDTLSSTVDGHTTSISNLTTKVNNDDARISVLDTSVSWLNANIFGIIASQYLFINNKGFSSDNGGLIGSTSIACETFFAIGDNSRINFSYSDEDNNRLNICVAWYNENMEFIIRDSWHYIDEQDYNTKPNDASYFRLAFGLYTEDNVNIGDDTANYTLQNLKVVFSSGAIIDEVEKNTNDILEIQRELDIIANKNIEYDGEPIIIKPKLGFELLAKSTHASALQGGAAFGDYYFQFHGQNNKNGQGVANLFYGVEIFNLVTKTKVQEILLGFDCLKHNNSASFSNQYYDVSDAFPLLYVSQEAANARYVTVYRVQGVEGSFTLTMVQVIYLPPTSQGANYYYPNCFVDLIAPKIVFSGFSNTDNTKYTFEEWNLPLISAGDTVQIGRVTMTDGGDGTSTEVDGFTLPNGKVVRRNNNDSTTEIKAVLLQENDALKTFYISRVNPYTNTNATTQGGCMFDGKVYQSFGSANNSVLKVIDVENEKVVSTIDLTKIENYEPEAVFVFNDKIGFACNASGKIKCLLT